MYPSCAVSPPPFEKHAARVECISHFEAKSEKLASPSVASLFGEMKLTLLLLATMKATALVISPAVINSPRTVNSHIAMSTYGERLVSSHAQPIRHTLTHVFSSPVPLPQRNTCDRVAWQHRQWCPLLWPLR